MNPSFIAIVLPAEGRVRKKHLNLTEHFILKLSIEKFLPRELWVSQVWSSICFLA